MNNKEMFSSKYEIRWKSVTIETLFTTTEMKN